MEKVLFYTYLLQDIDLQKRNLGDNYDDGDGDDEKDEDEDEDYNNDIDETRDDADDSCWDYALNSYHHFRYLFHIQIYGDGY